MKILVINAGSSSLKYQLVNMSDESVLAKGTCERIGLSGHIKHVAGSVVVRDDDTPLPDHTSAFSLLMSALTEGPHKVIDHMSDISAVGHRVVHGGTSFSRSVLIDGGVLQKVKELCELAPLHNPAGVQGIEACTACLGSDVPQVAVFDTAFHQSMPDYAYMYGINYERAKKYQIRRYGFHGTSHRYVSERAAHLLGRDLKELKMITCHMGNGSSITAIECGKSIDTSMGFTPLEGMIMGTRCGSIDPSIVMFLMDKEHLDWRQMNDVLNRQSGVNSISGVSSDDRDVQAAIREGNPRAELALSMFRYQARKFIGQYVAAMDGLDVLVFTGGIGENVTNHREKICEHMRYVGVQIDKEINARAQFGVECEVSTSQSKVRVMVIPTNEELVIARDTRDVVGAL